MNLVMFESFFLLTNFSCHSTIFLIIFFNFSVIYYLLLGKHWIQIFESCFAWFSHFIFKLNCRHCKHFHPEDKTPVRSSTGYFDTQLRPVWPPKAGTLSRLSRTKTNCIQASQSIAFGTLRHLPLAFFATAYLLCTRHWSKCSILKSRHFLDQQPDLKLDFLNLLSNFS